jgi:hypothetical protein
MFYQSHVLPKSCSIKVSFYQSRVRSKWDYTQFRSAKVMFYQSPVCSKMVFYQIPFYQSQSRLLTPSQAAKTAGVGWGRQLGWPWVNEGYKLRQCFMIKWLKLLFNISHALFIHILYIPNSRNVVFLILYLQKKIRKILKNVIQSPNAKNNPWSETIIRFLI